MLAIFPFSLFFACTCAPSAPQEVTQQTVGDSIPNISQYLLFGSGKKSSEISDSLSISEIALLQEGDILLRKGYGSVSDFIADFLQEQYPVTHCGFVIHKNDSTLHILHTISNDQVNGMFTEPLAAYVKQSQWGSLVAVRLKSDSANIQLVLDKAHQLVAAQIPFDLGFDDNNSESLYCVEMMRDIFLAVYHKDLLPKRTVKKSIDVLSMDNFFDATNFEVVFNHFDSISNKKPN